MIMLGIVLLVQQVEGHVLQPLVLGTAVKVHPLAVVFAVGGRWLPRRDPRRAVRGAVHRDAQCRRQVHRLRGVAHESRSDGQGAVPRCLIPTRSLGPALADFEAAAERLRGIADVTPMQSSTFLTGLLGAPVYLKCENLQRTGSYKIRGAYNRLAQLSDEEKARGVVAASAGNHAQGVAWAARELGIQATIFMPIGVALPKLQATRGYGADVQLVGNVVDETLQAAAEYAERTGAVVIHPFDHRDIVAGQGSLGLEILEQVPDVGDGRGAGRRRRADRRGRQRHQTARCARRAHRAGDRRAGSELGRVPGLARARRAGAASRPRRPSRTASRSAGRATSTSR